MMDTEVLRSGIGEKTWSSSSIPRLIMDEDTVNAKPKNKDVVSGPLKEVRAKIRQEVRRESIASIFGIHTAQRRDSGLEDKRGRRKSWHPKFERKRRKGIVVPSVSPPGAGSPLNIPEQRQKRASWWNIFVPDNWPSRSRRASQDVGRVYRSAENVVPWLRSKSRSVDHGVSAPFDIEALRSKVEGRFESVDKLSRDGSESEGSHLTEKKKPQGPPENTTTYTVADRDTLTSVAARFDTTPSELTKLNRLGTPYIFPGQQLYVPLREKLDEESEATTPVDEGHDDLPPEEKELLDNLRPVSPKPGHAERVRTPLGTPAASTDMEEEAAFKERFLKINVRHITDGQGVVGGVLLVTPNAVMFDPNVSDPLVIEHGPESYGVIAPMEFVVNAAIYHDIAHMRVGHSTHISSSDPKPEIYYVKSSSCDKCETHSPGKDSLLVKDETFPELVAGGDDAESVCSCAERDRDGDAFPKAFERDLVTPTNLSTETDQKINEIKTAEERRKSMLDHHWAIPSKDRSLDADDNTPPGSATPMQIPPVPVHQNLLLQDQDNNNATAKPSCHDSGIDIREPIPIVPAIPAKAKYSDADIVLSTDWVPPVTIVPTNVVSTQQEDSPCAGGRKKTSSVSFSLDSTNEGDSGKESGIKDEHEKHETKKNKMLKRLSYPLAWMETLAGEKEEDKVSSLPHSADSHSSSVFSKVFSSSPINLVDFGTGLFLSKTPSEESGGSGGAPLTPAVAGSDSPCSATVDSSSSAASMFFSTNSIISSVGRSSVGTFIRQPTTSISESSSSSKSSKPPAPKLDYRSMVSVEDMPELFVSFDKLIPRPARSCDDPPLYLRLRMGKPMGRVIPRSTPIMSYGKKKMRPEYWFSVPRNRVDELYKFLHLWVPHLYGELCPDEVKAKGFELVESDTELWDDDSPGTAQGSRHPSQDGEITELTKESWELIKAPYVKIYSILKTQTMSGDSDLTTDEVLPMSEELRRALYATSSVSLDVEITPPDLVGVTEILTDEHREKLCRHLPARAEGYVWTLVFSTSQHGFSLNSMYRKMNKLESPVLLVIEDTDNNVFGALTSCALKVSDHFYGTGESLLFRFTPQFQVFNWTGENLYFIKGNNESLSIGAGDGKFGLWLDGDLYQGRTESCKTYGNEPLTPSVDFVVKTLECWAFI